ncbi:MAG TPA: hypothetical protein VGW75_10085 [Solirubrobacteraceae bacterium]|nr:hypothetical protein [Solirubrobacteraceae bacterium]
MSSAEDPGEHAIGYQVLPRGTPVVAADGQEVGTFDRALHHGREHLFDGMVIRTEDGRRFVDAPEVARITNRRVTLSIDSAAVRELPEHKGALGGLQDRAQRRARRLGRRLGR